MVTRYGTAELFGYNFSGLTPQKIREFSAAHYKEIPCPFKPIVPGKPTPTCGKRGGVCSLRRYSLDDSGTVAPIGQLVTSCPQRFLEQSLVFEWVGEILLGNPRPVVISEVPFLMGETESREQEADAVGMIDKVLVSVSGQSLRWCALEMQAVYFSGKSMENDFKDMRQWEDPGFRFQRFSAGPTSDRQARNGSCFSFKSKFRQLAAGAKRWPSSWRNRKEGAKVARKDRCNANAE